jgi:hypothetical protein
MPYSDADYTAAKERELEAIDAIVSVLERYNDVIAIPEIVAISDILDYRLTTDRGVEQFKARHGKQTAEYVLGRFAHRNILTQELFEDTIVSALSETKD